MAKSPEIRVLSLDQLRALLKECVDRIGLGPTAELVKLDKPGLSRFIKGVKYYEGAPPRLMEGLEITRNVQYIVPEAKIKMLKSGG